MSVHREIRDIVEDAAGDVDGRLRVVASRLEAAAHASGPSDPDHLSGQELHGLAGIVRDCQEKIQEGCVDTLYDNQR